MVVIDAVHRGLHERFYESRMSLHAGFVRHSAIILSSKKMRGWFCLLGTLDTLHLHEIGGWGAETKWEIVSCRVVRARGVYV